MPEKELNEFREIKKEMKPVTDLNSFIDKCKKMERLETLASGLSKENTAYYQEVLEYNKRYTAYRKAMLKELFTAFQANKLGMPLADFINQVFAGEEAKTIISRSTTSIGTTPSQAEKIIQHLNLLNKEALDEIVVNMDKNFQFGMELMNQSVPADCELRKMASDPVKKAEFIKNANMPEGEAEKLLEDALKIATDNPESNSAYLDDVRQDIETLNTRENKEKNAILFENMDPVDKEKFIPESGTYILQGFNSKVDTDDFEIRNNYSVGAPAQEKITRVMDLMKKYDMLPNGLVQEQGSKIYAFHHYAELKLEIEKTTDPLKLKELVDKFNTEKAHLHEVIDLCKQEFGTKNYPGNVDVARTSMIESEFSSDLAGVSWMNSIYGLSSFVQASGKTLKEFMDAPKDALMKTIQDFEPEFGFNRVKGMDTEQAYTILSDTGHAAFPTYSLPRVYELFTLADTENQQKCFVDSIYFQGISTVAGNLINPAQITNSKEEKSYNRLAGFLLENGDYEKIMDGSFNPFTRVKIQYHPEEAIKNKNLDPAKISEKLGIMLSVDAKMRPYTFDGSVLRNYKKLAELIVNEKHLENDPDAFLLNKVKNARSGEELLAIGKGIKDIHECSMMLDKPGVSYRDADGNPLTVKNAGMELAFSKPVSVIKDGVISDILFKEIKHSPNLEVYFDTKPFIHNGKLDIQAFDRDLGTKMNSWISGHPEEENSENYKDFASMAKQLLEAAEPTAEEGYFMKQLAGVRSYLNLKHIAEDFMERKAGIDALDAAMNNKNISYEIKDVTGTVVSFEDAMEKAGNHEPLFLYDAENHTFSSSLAVRENGEYNAQTYHAHNIMKSAKHNQHILDNLRNRLESHNPLYMMMRNMFSSGPYSQIIDAIDELKKQDLSNPEVMKEGLERIEEKALAYYQGKLTDGKKKTTLNEERTAMGLTVLCEIRATVSGYDLAKMNQAALEEEDRHNLDDARLDIEVNDNNEINNDFEKEKPANNKEIVKEP